MASSGFVNINVASQYTSLATSTLYEWASKGWIPSYKKYGRLIFDKDELDAWIKVDQIKQPGLNKKAI